jgi:hypothetical protein
MARIGLRPGERDMSGSYKSIYSQDFDVSDQPHGWIQWKGTDVCIDLHCECGAHCHFDGDFLYHWECPHCHAKYAIGCNVKLIKLNAEQVKHVENGNGFKTSQKDESH